MHTLKLYEKQLGAVFRFSCGAPSAVEITFRDQAFRGAPPDALGAARVANGRVLPEIEIFRRPVRQLIREADPHLEGRAIGAVAAHEIGHYLRQRTGHDSHGIHAPQLTARHLLHGLR